LIIFGSMVAYTAYAMAAAENAPLSLIGNVWPTSTPVVASCPRQRCSCTRRSGPAKTDPRPRRVIICRGRDHRDGPAAGCQGPKAVRPPAMRSVQARRSHERPTGEAAAARLDRPGLREHRPAGTAAGPIAITVTIGFSRRSRVGKGRGFRRPVEARGSRPTPRRLAGCGHRSSAGWRGRIGAPFGWCPSGLGRGETSPDAPPKVGRGPAGASNAANRGRFVAGSRRRPMPQATASRSRGSPRRPPARARAGPSRPGAWRKVARPGRRRAGVVDADAAGAGEPRFRPFAAVRG